MLNLAIRTQGGNDDGMEGDGGGAILPRPSPQPQRGEPPADTWPASRAF
jgi:hypothetical protein